MWRRCGITNVPSFLHSRDLEIDCPGLGKLTVDVAYGGNFYCIVDPQENFSDLADVSVGDLLRWSPALRTAMNERYEFVHPENAGHPRLHPHHVDRQAAEARLDRPATPCSTATRRSTARPAAPAPRRAWRNGTARGKLQVGDAFIHEIDHRLDLQRPRREGGAVGNYRRHRSLDCRLGAADRAQHHLHRRPRPVRPRLLAGLTFGGPQLPYVKVEIAKGGRLGRTEAGSDPWHDGGACQGTGPQP